ncbi:MAG: PfkB family carbohydrate kinase, partial [Ilumatobacteraceae bacterium]
LWDGADSARRELDVALDSATIAVGNRAECEVAVGTSDPHEAVDRLLGRGLSGVVVKLGADGALVATGAERRRMPAVPVTVVCGLGAGDAFGGALCHGLLSGWSLRESARWGNAAGAIVAGRLMCADDMPTATEIDEVLGRAPALDGAPCA